jgi:hypothetical protein
MSGKELQADGRRLKESRIDFIKKRTAEYPAAMHDELG